jgi:hypothetical protein
MMRGIESSSLLLVKLLQLMQVPSKLDGCGRNRRRRRLRRHGQSPVHERRRGRIAEVRLSDGDEILLIRVVKSADDARILLLLLDSLPAVVVVGVVPSVLLLLPLLLLLLLLSLLLPRPPRPVLPLAVVVCTVVVRRRRRRRRRQPPPPPPPHLPLDELADVRMRHHRGRRRRPYRRK